MGMVALGRVQLDPDFNSIFFIEFKFITNNNAEMKL